MHAVMAHLPRLTAGIASGPPSDQKKLDLDLRPSQIT